MWQGNSLKIRSTPLCEQLVVNRSQPRAPSPLLHLSSLFFWSPPPRQVLPFPSDVGPRILITCPYNPNSVSKPFSHDLLPANKDSNSDLPLPLGPISAVISPGQNLPETFFNF